jgi:hypothetical protein
MNRVGQNRVHTLHMTVYLVFSLPKTTYKQCVYMILAIPSHKIVERRT